MTHKTTITDNYILITSDEKIKEGEWCYIPFEHSIKRFGKYFADDWKKVIAHLPITDSADLRGVLLLPPLPSVEDEVEKLAIKHATNPGMAAYVFPDKKESFIEGYNKSKEKYKFTEEDAKLLIDFGFLQNTKNKCINLEERRKFIQSLSQPKMPTSFSPNMVCDQCNGDESTDSCYCHHGSYKIVPQIINGVMQGEWIY